MCGIAALFSTGAGLDLRDIVAMTRSVAHRGPDGEGWVVLGGEGLVECELGSPGGRLGLGHRRLSVLDLSDAGRQPMRRGHLWMVCNAEIYNFVELRRELAWLGEQFVSESDSEVLLAAFATWGAEAFGRLRGMWALVIVDTRDQVAWLCRDRLGMKPMFCAATPGGFACVSEIRQLRPLAHLSLVPEDETVSAYLQTGWEDATHTFFRGVEPIRAGSYRWIDLRSGRVSPCVSYWHPERIEVAIQDPDEAAEALAPVLSESLQLHCRSDVALGCTLSGGLDSSAILASLSELRAPSGERVAAFTAGFPGSPDDEMGRVAVVGERCGAQLHVVEPSGRECLEELDRFVSVHDEPVGSASQYAAFRVAQRAREMGVSVVLSGQGGDEVLGGYWETTLAGMAAECLQGKLLRGGVAALACLLPGGNRELWRQAPRVAMRLLNRRRPERLLQLVMGMKGRNGPAAGVLHLSETERRILEVRDLTLPRLLKWDDRNFMANSVEARFPFLDHKVIELCLGMSRRALLFRGWTKEPLRRAFAGRLPAAILRQRRKVGFEVPQAAWLAGPLSKTVKSTIMSNRSPLWSYVEVKSARELLRRFLGLVGRGNGREEGQALFRLVMADCWLRQQGAQE